MTSNKELSLKHKVSRIVKSDSLTEWYDIPCYPDYSITKNMRVRKLMNKGTSYAKYKTLTKTHGVFGKLVFVNLMGVKEWVLVSELYQLTFGETPEVSRCRFIKLNSGEGRVPFNRFTAYNLILRFMKEVHIRITPNSSGVYETTPTMEEKGMIACKDCGHIQAIEIRICKNCNEFITI